MTRTGGMVIRTPEAARRLGIGIRDVYQLVLSGELPGWPNDEGLVVLPTDAVEHHRRRHTADAGSGELIRTYEASRRLGIGIRDVYQLVLSGELPGWPNTDGLVVLPADAVDEYRRRVPPA